MDIKTIQGRILSLYRETDRQMDNFPKVCKQGCSFCCHQNIRIFAAEELIITDYIDSKLDNRTKTRIRAQMAGWIDYFKSNTPHRQLDQQDIVQFEKRVASDKVPCPFLVDGGCSIYPVRPFVCRVHVAIDDPGKCDTDRLRNAPDAARTSTFVYYMGLAKAAPMNIPRLLPHAFKDYFNIPVSLPHVEVPMPLDML